MNDSYGDGWNGVALTLTELIILFNWCTSTACIDTTVCMFLSWTPVYTTLRQASSWRRYDLICNRN